MTIDTGGPAFPVVGHWYGDKLGGQLAHGMTLRDYFAAKAMQGLLASNAEHDIDDAEIFVAIGKASYDIADAMIAERGKK